MDLRIWWCTDSTYVEFDPFANVDNGSCLTPIIFGLTDSLASNYNADAMQEDGSCEYQDVLIQVMPLILQQCR